MSKLKLILFVTSSLLAQRYEYHSSVRVETVPEEPIFATSPAALDGEYAIINAYTGHALGSQEMFGHYFAAQFQASSTWKFTPLGNGRYQISSARGSLAELDSNNGVHLVSVGSGQTWEVSAVNGADTFVIRSAAGRALEIHDWMAMDGKWVTTYEQNGGSNQEWRIVTPSSVMTTARAGQMHIRGKGQKTMAIESRPVKTPTVTWSKDAGGSYTYRLKLSDPHVTRVWMNRGAHVFDSKEVAGQPGWRQTGGGWVARKGTAGVDGELAMSTAWGPGPVIVDTFAAEGQPLVTVPDFAPTKQHDTALMAGIFRGSHAWVIGPAVEPGLDLDGLHKLAEKLVLDGMAFLHPLVYAKDMRAAFRTLKPSNSFEREVVRVLQPQIEVIQ